MTDFATQVREYRQKAEELLTKADDFEDPANRKTITILAEEYLAMADRLQRVMDSYRAPEPPKK